MCRRYFLGQSRQSTVVARRHASLGPDLDANLVSDNEIDFMQIGNCLADLWSDPGQRARQAIGQCGRTHYSARNDVAGSMRMARRTGTMAAAALVASSSKTIVPIITGSPGVTWNN